MPGLRRDGRGDSWPPSLPVHPAPPSRVDDRLRVRRMSQLASSLLARLQSIVHGGLAPSGAGPPFGQSGGQRMVHHAELFANPFADVTLSPQDRRQLEKTARAMQGVMAACSASRLNLKNSPPFILDILPDTLTQLIAIFRHDPTAIRHRYLDLFLKNVIAKCKEVGRLFKSAAVYMEQSPERRQLTKLSLVFSHMLTELKAFFHQGEFAADKFRFTKREASVFWEEAFKGRTFVPWDEFLDELSKAHVLSVTSSEVLKEKLKSTIDLTCSDHISNFEFDVFTRLFYPWKTLVKNWELLTTAHPGYVAFLTYDEVKKQLEQFTNKPGSYVFRLSCTRLGQWAIGYVAPDGKIYQTIPQNKSLIEALKEGSREGFYLYPNGKTDKVDLMKAFELPPADRVRVTSEQHEIYCEMGTTFELCKICDDHEKDRKLEPCGHLLCHRCLKSWSESDSTNTCPFCRYEIKGTSNVVIDKYRKEEVNRHSTVSAVSCSTPLITFPESPSSETAPPSLAPPLPMAPPLPPRSKEGSGKRLSKEAVALPTVPVPSSAEPVLLAPSITVPPLPPAPVVLEAVTPLSARSPLPENSPLYVNVPEEPASYVNASVITSAERERAAL